MPRFFFRYYALFDALIADVDAISSLSFRCHRLCCRLIMPLMALSLLIILLILICVLLDAANDYADAAIFSMMLPRDAAPSAPLRCR